MPNYHPITDQSNCLRVQDLVVYECTPRAFTASATSGLDDDTRGSFLGIAEKVAHIKDAGYNAVELLPVFHFDEMEFQLSPNPRDHMLNTWGYSTMAFFAPMTVYASKGAGPQQVSLFFNHRYYGDWTDDVVI